MSLCKKCSTKITFISLISFGLVVLLLFGSFLFLNCSNDINLNYVHEAYAEATKPFIVDSNIIGPFDVDSSDCNLNLTFKSSIYYSDIIPRFRYGTSSSNLYYASTKPCQDLEPQVEYKATFVFPGSDLAVLGSIYIIIDFVKRDYQSSIFSKNFTIHRIQNYVLNLNAHLGQIWNSNILGFQIKNSEIIYYGDSLSTVDTIDYINVDYYYRLDVSYILFKFDSIGKSYDKAEITFEDEYNLFPDFDKDPDDGEIHIPLRINMNYMPYMIIEFNKGFYVNPNDLSMSSKAKSGYKPTNYFYLPVNELNKVNEYKFNFRVFGLGLNKSDLLLTLDYDVSRRFFGRCDASEYCVVGEIVS